MPFKTPFKLGHRLSSFRKTQHFQRLDREESSGGGGSPPGPTTWTWLDGSTHIWRDGSEAEWLTPTADFSFTPASVATGSPTAGATSLTINGADPFPDPGEQLLATVSSPPSAAYSPRKLIGGATNAMDVRRGGDDATTTIGFSNGSLDAATLESWASAAGGDGNAYVTRLYDQSGNGSHLEQATPANQPPIVVSGSVVRNDKGHIMPDLVSQMLTATHPSTLPNDDITLVIVNQEPFAHGHGDTRQLVDIGGINVLNVEINDSDSIRARIGNGSSNDQIAHGESSLHNYTWWPNILTIRKDGTGYTVFRNNEKTVEGTSSKTSSSDAVTLGGASSNIKIGDFLIYPALSDADQATLYDSINDYYQYGSASTDQNTTLFRQQEPWEPVIYDWMETVTLPDVTIAGRANASHDGTTSGDDESFNLWLTVARDGGKFDVENIMKAPPEWFLLDDGFGGGIEGTGKILYFRAGGNDGCQANNALFWHDLSLPLAASGQGNPYYQNSAVAMRALMQAATNLLAMDTEHAENFEFATRNYYLGGALLGSVNAVKSLQSYLPANVYQAFIDGFEWQLEKLRLRGSSNLFGNMEMKGIAAAAAAHGILDDDGKDIAERAARLVLFGSETGTPATTNWNPNLGRAGIYSLRGDMCEGQGPEASYNGHAYRYESQARASTRGVVAWDFLDEIIDGMMDWYGYQAFPEPAGSNVTHFGPSGFAGRTGRPIIEDQGNSYAGRAYSAAADRASALPHARIRGGLLVDSATMLSEIATGVAALNSSGLADELVIEGTAAAHTNGVETTTVQLTNSPDLSQVTFGTRNWRIRLYLAGGTQTLDVDASDNVAKTVTLDASTPVNIPSGTPVNYRLTLAPVPHAVDGSHWPSYYRWLPPNGTYAAIKALQDASDASIFYPFEKVNTPFVKTLADDFVSVMGTDGSSLDFGYFIESMLYQGTYNGWYGGSMQAFWTRDYGLAILAMHDKAGSDIPDENTRVWSEIDTWATGHTWGKDDSGTPTRFSTATASGPNVTFARSIDPVTGDGWVEVTIGTGSTGGSEGQETGSEISGWLKRRFAWTKQVDGVEITVTLTSNQADLVTELWENIPCFLQPDNAGSDAEVSYWAGATYLPVPSSVVTTDTIRLKRTLTAGDKFVYVTFPVDTEIRGSDAVYEQDYQGTTRIKNVRVNMHANNTGAAALLPANKSVTYKVTTTDPGNTATDPIAAITYPSATSNLPQGRRWAVQASVEFFGASAYNVNVEYHNGSSWATVGTMTLVSGTPGVTSCVYQYLGGSVPTDVEQIRLNASDNVGSTTVGTEITITDKAYTQVLEADMTGTDGTTINSSYTITPTNTTGNLIINPPSDPAPTIASNQASIATDGATGRASIQPVNNSEKNDWIVEADVTPNHTTSGSPGDAYGPGICARHRTNTDANFRNGLVLELKVTAGASTYDARVLEQSGFTFSTTIPGSSAGTTYRLCLDLRQSCVIWQVRNASTDAVIIEGVRFDATYRAASENDAKATGFKTFKQSGVSPSTVDNFKVWRP